MPAQLLPASAAAFAPRASSVNVVLGPKVEPWLTQTLKRVNKVKRPLNSVPQHQKCLSEILSSETAIWTLTSLMLLKDVKERREDEDPLVEAIFNYDLLHIEAYIVHVDMVLRNEVAFKLTPDTIKALIAHHKTVHCGDVAAKSEDWPEKESQLTKMHEDFIQAVNKYVYRTHVSALEGLEEQGLGELLCGKSDEVKLGLCNLFHDLTPPPPKVKEVVRQPLLLPNSPNASQWWGAQSSIASESPSPVDPWRVVPSSSPQPTTAATTPDTQMIWPCIPFSEGFVSSPSPPAFAEPFPSTTMFYRPLPAITPIPSLPLPSMLTHSQCGMGLGYNGFGSGFGSMAGLGWERVQDNYGTTM